MSLARSFLSDPHGMIFIHASCDQPLMNSPITKLSFVILNAVKNLKNSINGLHLAQTHCGRTFQQSFRSCLNLYRQVFYRAKK